MPVRRGRREPVDHATGGGNEKKMQAAATKAATTCVFPPEHGRNLPQLRESARGIFGHFRHIRLSFEVPSAVMFIFGIIFLVVALILIGVGIAFGALLFVAAAAAIGVGMLSTSVACGILRQKPSAGIRLFFYQFFIVTFLAFGIALTWLVSALAELHFSGWSVVTIGSIAGIGVGLLFAVVHSYLLDVIVKFLIRLFHGESDSNPGTPPLSAPTTDRLLEDQGVSSFAVAVVVRR